MLKIQHVGGRGYGDGIGRDEVGARATGVKSGIRGKGVGRG
jgi:hypothetical protein